MSLIRQTFECKNTDTSDNSLTNNSLSATYLQRNNILGLCLSVPNIVCKIDMTGTKKATN